MTRPFRFEPLLDLAEQREGAQTQVLAAVNVEEHAARETLRRLEAELEQAYALVESPRGRFDAEQYRGAVSYAERLAEQISAQRAALDEIGQRVGIARDALLEVVKERRSFEHLRDQDEATALAVEDRREASRVDDLNMSRHIRRGA